MAVTVSVYGKRGLKRGDPVFNANFLAIEGSFVLQLLYHRPGPLTGVSPTYTVEQTIWWDNRWAVWTPRDNPWLMEVGAPNFQSETFYVRDGETHDVWLSPR